MKRMSATVSGSTAVSVIAGLCTSCATAVIGIAIIAMLVDRGALAMEGIHFGTMCSHFISLFAGCFIAGLIKKEKVLYSVGIVFALIYAICCGITVLFYNGQFSGMIANLTFGVLGTICVILICLKRYNGSRRKMKRKIC